MSKKAVGAEAKVQTEQKTAPTIQELEQGIADRLRRVEEFRFIQDEATKLGVRAYLFGGTAAGYAHYIKWDMQREKGDSRFQKDRFDYDYTNIYRSTQDLDIVIDGNPDQANKLQQALQQKYPHLQGGKTAWEVRLLTQDMGDKQAILNNPDFMNQHTDSNSTGMIEITQPKAGESVVRDVRDWNAKQPHFLKDVHDGALHYYFSNLHETTKFAKEGRNPPIISAIRFLTKAFQYELTIRPEDLEQIRKIIREFDPQRGTSDPYVAKWIEKNGKKLFQNAVNLEYAFNTLEQLGLRKKLQAIKNDIGTVDSLAWWMNKEPLRSHALGQGGGKTAKELGLDIVAHETNNFLAYESITRAHTGDPNVLISRDGAAGEAALHGDGFYTKTGKEGARGTGLTIRFHLDPNAKEGHDFAYVKEHGYVVVKNKAALKVIPESLNIGPLEYFKMLAEGDGTGLKSSDKGILEKLKRRIDAKLRALTDHEMKEITQVIQSEIQKYSNPDDSAAVREWFSLPNSKDRPELIKAIIEKRSPSANVWLVQYVLSQPHWRDYPELVEKLIQAGTVDRNIAQHILSKPHWKDHPEFVEKLIIRGNVDKYIAEFVLSHPHWKDHPELVEQLIEKGTVNDYITWHVLSHPHWKDHPELVEQLIKKGKVDMSIAKYVLSQSHWKDHPEFVEQLVKKGTADETIAQYVLSQPYWKDHPEFVEQLIKKGKVDWTIAQDVLSQPHWKDHPEFVEQLIKKGKVDMSIAQDVLSQPHWKDHPEFVEQLIKKGTEDGSIAQYVLSHPHWKDHPELVEQLIKKGKVDSAIASYVLSKPHWKDHPELVEKLIKKGTVDIDIAESVLSQPHWKDHPEFVEQLIKKGTMDIQMQLIVLSQPHWIDHPELRRLTGGQPPSVENLRAAFARGETVHVSPRTCVLQHLTEGLR
jgi:ABC-type taurine transport system substrate-binding protein